MYKQQRRKIFKKLKNDCAIIEKSSKQDFHKKDEWYIENSTDDLRREFQKPQKMIKKREFLKP